MVQNVHSITHPRGRIARAGEPGALWAKDCPCDSPSAMNAMRTRSFVRADGYYDWTVSLVPGPSCNGCGRPWREAMMGESNDTRGGEG